MFSKSNIVYFFIIIIFLIIQPSFAQVDKLKIQEPIVTSSFFLEDDTLSIDLKFDLTLFKRQKPDTVYIDAVLSIKGNDIPVRVKARGNFRKEHCTFPSFWLNLKNTNLIQDSIYDTKKIKVVSHCKELRVYSKYLLKEYITYRLYNIINNNSFRVRLVNINYKSNKLKKQENERWAILIEPDNFLAERIESYPLKMDDIRYVQLDPVNEVTMAFFQYMIGNTDFAIKRRHNVKLFITKDHKQEGIIPIPYDFDYCGLVNTYYAVPFSDERISSVVERSYYGACRDDSLYNAVIDHFLSKKQEILNFISSFEYLPNGDRRSMLNYIEKFYKEIQNPKFIKKEIRPFCIDPRARLKFN